MKPDWNNAPEWAQWVAMDVNGHWYWYRIEPDCDWTHCWSTELRKDLESAECFGGSPDWKKSLERRPT